MRLKTLVDFRTNWATLESEYAGRVDQLSEG